MAWFGEELYHLCIASHLHWLLAVAFLGKANLLQIDTSIVLLIWSNTS